jgi:hypothetical protein
VLTPVQPQSRSQRPPAPVANTYFAVSDAAANAETNKITVDFGAESYNGISDEDFEIDVNEFGTGFLYDGSTWRMVK